MVLTRLLRVLAVVGLLSGSLILGAGAAQAGGPTSALLVSPGNHQAAALYYSDPEYEQLANLLGGYDPVPDNAAPAPPESTSGISGNYVTVTWLIHDVSIWRIDRIFLTSGAEPWIVTEMLDGSSISEMGPGQSGDENAIWHRTADSAQLTALLTGLGLLGSSTQMVSDAFAPVADQQPVAAPVQAAPVDATARAGAPWWWILAGLAAGALFTAALIRYVPGIRAKVLERPADDTVRMVEQPG